MAKPARSRAKMSAFISSCKGIPRWILQELKGMFELSIWFAQLNGGRKTKRAVDEDGARLVPAGCSSSLSSSLARSLFGCLNRLIGSCRLPFAVIDLHREKSKWQLVVNLVAVAVCGRVAECSWRARRGGCLLWFFEGTWRRIFFQVPKSTAKSITKFFLQKSTTKSIAKSIADGRLQIVDYKRSITAY